MIVRPTVDLFPAMPKLFLYTLRLQDDCWYVGTTAAPPTRLQAHIGGQGAEWTRVHPVLNGFHSLKLLDTGNDANTMADARLQEDLQVKRLMHVHGLSRVRGGSYSRVHLSRDDVKALSKELWHANGGCLRCGRASHWKSDCFAVRDVAGHVIRDDATRSRHVGGRGQGAGRGAGRDRAGRSRAGTRNGGVGAPSPALGCQCCGRLSPSTDLCFACTDAFNDEDKDDTASEWRERLMLPVVGFRGGHWASSCYHRAVSGGVGWE